MNNHKTIRKTALTIALVAFVMSTMLIFSSSLAAQDTAKVAKEEIKAVKAEAKDVKKEEAKAEEKDDKKEEKVAIEGSDKKGKYFYKKECKSCHGKGGDGGELTPVSKTIKQWQRFFKKDEHGEKTLSKEFDGEMLIHIRTFLINHAADSDQPETCG